MVLFSMSSDKALGLDDFTVGFFNKAWSIVADDFYDAPTG